MPSEPTPKFIEGLYEAMRKRAADLAPHFSPGYGTAELDSEDLETLWDRRAMPLEKEWELHRAMKTDGTPLYTPAQIGQLVFPERAKLAASGGRVEPKEQIKWVNRTAQRMAEKRAQRQAALEQPPDIPEQGGY